mgnify:CR=1 FL=1
MVKNDLNWLIGGAQGSGVDSSATIFARACNYAGLHVFGKREYYSNIMGEHSYFIVRVHSNPIRSHFNQINLFLFRRQSWPNNKTIRPFIKIFNLVKVIFC